MSSSHQATEESKQKAKPTSDVTSSRGVGFPQMPISEAVKAIQDIGKYGFEHATTAVAGYLGHSTPNSGPYRAKLSALKDWNLVKASGDRISLTDSGRRVAAPPSGQLEQADLQQVFLSCQVFASLYNMLAKERDLDVAALGNTAVHNLRVNIKSKDRFVESFVASAIAVGLAEMNGNKIKLRVANQGLATSDAGGETPSAQSAAVPPRANATAPRVTSSPVVWRQPIALSAGELLLELRLDRPIPAAAFGQLQSVAQALDALADVLGRVPSVETPIS